MQWPRRAHPVGKTASHGACAARRGAYLLRVGTRRAALVVASLSAIVLAVPSTARATPAFARQTGMNCTTCHEAWPRLTDFGELFRDNGYQLPGRTTSMPLSPDSFPIAARAALLYQFTATPGTPPTSSGSGSVATPEADLFVGGSLANDVAAFLTISGFGAGGLASLETASVRLSNVFGTSWLNVRAGLFAFDLPASEHRTLTLTAPYTLYHYHPTNSTNLFELAGAQTGVEIMGHPNGAGLRYVIALVDANGSIGTSGIFSAPTGYAHVTGTIYPMTEGLTRLRLGAFGALGFWPTRYAGMTTMPTPGTGTDLRPFATIGAELAATFGPVARPFTIQIVGSYGHENAGLVPNGVRDSTYASGFAELVYTPGLSATIFARYGIVRALASADPMQPAGVGDSDDVVAGGRWNIVQSRSAALAAQIEGHWLLSTVMPGAPPMRQLTIAGGLDVAF